MSAVPLQANGLDQFRHQNQQNNSQNVVVRFFKIPAIQETVDRLTSIVRSYGIGAFFYEKTEQTAKLALRLSEPIQRMLPLQQLNGFGNNCLDAVQNRYPRVFEAHADELLASAKAQAMKPADQAREVFSQRLNGAQASLSSVQDRLGQLTEHAPRSADDVNKIVRDVLAELNKNKEAIVSQVNSLPANVRTNVEPYAKDLQNGLNHIADEFSRTDVPLQTRAANTVKYLQETATPVLQNILNSVKSKKDDAKSYAEATARN